MLTRSAGFLALLLIVVPSLASRADDLADALSKLSSTAIVDESMRDMVRADLRSRLQAANDRSSEAWRKIETRQQWEAFRNQRIAALRESLGPFDAAPRRLDVRVAGTLDGDRYRIKNLVFRSQYDMRVTANLYLPEQPPESMPGILICHSHHRPKEHGELQDMGMTWARLGCAVLVMDQLGHGERRQHPFRSSADFDGEFRVSRQDYYFRYDTGIQLHLMGESLAGWIAHDLMRGVDVLRAEPGVDPKRIMLLGAVAGGGDPAAVAAAVDERITAAAPFNFGGPQPETRFPLPENVEATFNYAGSGGWESTRNLRRSAGDGFLPWAIVGGIAPRRLVFSHEFNWDRPHDPVWKRLQKIYSLYEQPSHLDYTHGRGELRGQPPEATHCTHIGRFHRRRIHLAISRWFSLPISPDDDEYSQRRDAGELRCMTDEEQRALKTQPLNKLLGIAAFKIFQKESRSQRDKSAARSQFAALLGAIEPQPPRALSDKPIEVAGANARAVVLQTEKGIRVPLLLLLPQSKPSGKAAIVIGVAQSGKSGFLKHRAGDIAELLRAGNAVCLPDLRGTGESKAGNDRGKRSAATSRSSTELMLGGTMVGQRLQDLRSVMRFLKARGEIDAKRIAVWGDSFAPVNPPDARFRAPRRIDGRARESEPLGGMLALLTALYEDDVQVVCVNGGLASFRSVLDSQFVYIPHDAVVPGWLTAGDLANLARLAAPRPLRLTNLVDGWNRRLSEQQVKDEILVAAKYEDRKASDHLTFDTKAPPGKWIAKALAK